LAPYKLLLHPDLSKNNYHQCNAVFTLVQDFTQNTHKSAELHIINLHKGRQQYWQTLISGSRPRCRATDKIDRWIMGCRMCDKTSQQRNREDLHTVQLSINLGLAAPSHETLLVATHAIALPNPSALTAALHVAPPRFCVLRLLIVHVAILYLYWQTDGSATWTYWRKWRQTLHWGYTDT